MARALALRGARRRAMKRYHVTLTAAERADLTGLVSRGKADVRRLKHAQILLKADAAAGGPGWPDERIAEAVDVGVATVERVRRRLVEEGLEAALRPYRVGGRVYRRQRDGEAQAHLIALACSPPPEGRGQWTLRLLAYRMVALHDAAALSHETVRQTLKTEHPHTASEADVVHPRPSTRPSSSSGTCWRSTAVPMIRGGRWSAWTRPSSS